MTKKEKIKKATDLIDFWKPKLNLSDWDISFSIVPNNDDNSIAEVSVQCPYKRAHIYIQDGAFEKPNDISHIVKHELCHCITEPLYVYCVDLLNDKKRDHASINDQREMMTEHIAKIVK